MRIASRIFPAVLAGTLIASALPASRAIGQSGVQPVVTSLTLFAGSRSGLWRSRDWGGSWQAAAAADRPQGLEGLGAVHAILPLGPQVFVGGEGGVFRSEDFGETWKRTPLPATVLSVLPSRYPQSDPTVFAGTDAGLWKSEDGAGSFQPTSLSGTPVFRIEWPGPALVLATGRGVAISSDAGRRFDLPGTGQAEGKVQALALSSFFVVDPVLFAGVGQAGVYRSSDGGKTWTAAGLQGHAVTDLVWLGPFLYAVSDGGLHRSEDTGKTWLRLGQGLAGRIPTRILFPHAPASGTEVFLATDDGIFHSTDGGQSFTRGGLSGQSVACLATFPAPQPVRKKR